MNQNALIWKQKVEDSRAKGGLIMDCQCGVLIYVAKDDVTKDKVIHRRSVGSITRDGLGIRLAPKVTAHDHECYWLNFSSAEKNDEMFWAILNWSSEPIAGINSAR